MEENKTGFAIQCNNCGAKIFITTRQDFNFVLSSNNDDDPQISFQNSDWSFDNRIVCECGNYVELGIH
jgi:hypothetical protein